MDKLIINSALEEEYIENLIRDIKSLSSNTQLINCNPLYSSRLTQIINHALSKSSLLEITNLEMPQLGHNQVWDGENYVLYDTYLKSWVSNNLFDKNLNYLFITDSIYNSSVFNKLRLILNKTQTQYKFATLIANPKLNFLSDYIGIELDVPFIYSWENPKIKR